MTLELALDVPLLGVPLQIRSNDPRAIGLAEESFGRWRALPTELVQEGPPARMDVIVEQRPGGLPGDAKLVIQATDEYFEARAGGVLLSCDRPAGHGLARVPPELLEADPAWYCWFVNAITMLPAGDRDRYPLHAGGVLVGDTAMLLLGASGQGKSTLTYAAARAGHGVLHEDTVHVAAAGGLRLWAHLEHFSLAPDTVRWFEELAGLAPVRLPHGKVRLAVPLATVGIRPVWTWAGPVALVEVSRSAGKPGFAPVPADGLLRDVVAKAEPGFDLMSHHAGPALAALAACPTYRLDTGSDPRAAVEVLESLAVSAKGGWASR